MDRLEAMFKQQQNLQRELKVYPLTQEYYNTMTLACIDELMESLRETPWKPWKKGQCTHELKLKEELTDVFHFFLNLCIFADMDAQELFDRYMLKNQENRRRHKNGY